MRLTVIGCSGSLPGPASAASCYLVEAPYGDGVFRLVLDLGSGAIGPLQQHVDLLTIDAVVLTHLHPDHCLDLCGFYVVRKFQPGTTDERIPVWGPPGAAERMAKAYDMPIDPGMGGQFEFGEYDGSAIELGPFVLETAGVDHPVDAYAIRVTHEGRSLVYSGDTAPCESFATIARGADLLIAEASFRDGEDNPEHLHMTGPQVATIANQAGVGRLVLTHIPPWYDAAAVLEEARPHFDGPIGLARPGLEIDV
jgi:ribonuclease BN (tRNA processing enzyme)